MMAPGGTLVLSLPHVLGPRQVRRSLQGSLSVFDQRPLLHDAEASFSIDRSVRALAVSGLVVRDLAEVQLWDRQYSLETVKGLLKLGIAATRYLVRVPGDRLWIRAERHAAAPGSVLIARRPGDEADFAHTREALRSFLPESWELIVGKSQAHECASWNEALTRSTGDFVWLLRAGDVPDLESFWRLRHMAPIGPGILVDARGESSFGLGGMMFDRVALFELGPLPDELESEMLAGEEYQLRAAALGRQFRPVLQGHTWQGRRPEAGARIRELSGPFLERWEGVDSLENPGDPDALEIETPPWELEDREPRISLCMIAKNEERFLEGCLARVHEQVDEIILVDTGSTDRTVEIAESFGAKVFFQEWEDDFAKPRNLSLEHASGDWILVLDADEYLTEDSIPKIRELARNERAAGYHVLFRNDHEDGKTGGVTMVRMFRKLPNIEYRYVIHEQVVMSLMEEANERSLALFPSSIEVLHYGYSDQVMDERDKRRRNVELFEKQLSHDPDDVYCLYKYSDFLRIIGEREDDVRGGFSRALDLLRNQVPSSYRMAPFAAEIAALLALQHARSGELDEADALVREGLQRFLPTPNLHYIAAGVSSSLGRDAEALEQYRHCLGFRDRNLAVPVQPGITSYVSYTGMASCWMQLGEFARAEDWLDTALFEEPGYEVAVLLRSVIDMQKGALDVALARLAERISVHGDSVPMRAHGAHILGRLGMWSQAQDWLEKAQALETVPNPATAKEAGFAALLAQNYGAAEQQLRGLDDDFARAELALLDVLQGRAASAPASPEAAKQLASSLTRSGREDWARLLEVVETPNTDVLLAEARR
jgi:glycosyltransferase involved in cell wall biosynthesis